MAWKKGLTFCSQAPLVGIPPSSAYEKTALCLIRAVISVGWQSIFGCFIVYPFVHRRKQQAKVNSNETLFENLSEGQRYYVENANTCTNNELLEITELLSGKNLTDSERNVLIWEFCFGMTSAEIARAKSVSRQSINQIKKRAIQKLRKELERDGIPLHEELS